MDFGKCSEIKLSRYVVARCLWGVLTSRPRPSPNSPKRRLIVKEPWFLTFMRAALYR